MATAEYENENGRYDGMCYPVDWVASTFTAVGGS